MPFLFANTQEDRIIVFIRSLISIYKVILKRYSTISSNVFLIRRAKLFLFIFCIKENLLIWFLFAFLSSSLANVFSPHVCSIWFIATYVMQSSLENIIHDHGVFTFLLIDLDQQLFLEIERANSFFIYRKCLAFFKLIN